MNQKNHTSNHIDDPSLWIPGLSIDCVIIGFDRENLNILILKWKDSDVWSLPGGFIQNDEDMDRAASRILEERTGIKLPFLRQFHTFGNVNRRNISPLLAKLDSAQQNFPDLIPWLKQRFVTTGYFSLVDIQKCSPTPDLLSEYCQWKPLNELPELMFDHGDIVTKAREQIRNQINYLPVGISLLPEVFTMKDLQLLYESILKKKLDRGNFQKKILKLGFLNRLEKKRDGGSHKAPYLYAFNQEKYNQLLEVGIGYL